VVDDLMEEGKEVVATYVNIFGVVYDFIYRSELSTQLLIEGVEKYLGSHCQILQPQSFLIKHLFPDTRSHYAELVTPTAEQKLKILLFFTPFELLSN
jgi:hypothetical protein